MRDDFDHYYAGWNLISGQTPEEKAAFALLVKDMSRAIGSEPYLQAAWKAHTFDDKASVFQVFFTKYVQSRQISPDLQGVVAKVRAKLKV